MSILVIRGKIRRASSDNERKEQVEMVADIQLQINGRTQTITAQPDTPLLYILRQDLGLKSPKYGCGLEQCGACMVLVDGQAVPSCRLPVQQAEGLPIVTVEGLGTADKLHPLQEAFIAEQAIQCGYCTAGMLIAWSIGLIRPELGNLASLETLDLAWNQLTGPIPAELGQLTKLKRLTLATNLLEEEIPAELAELPNLSHLDLSRNKLKGSVPADLCLHTTLETLNLSHNQLDIAEEMGSCHIAKISLQANSRSHRLLWPWLLRGGLFTGAVFCLHQLRKKPRESSRPA